VRKEEAERRELAKEEVAKKEEAAKKEAAKKEEAAKEEAAKKEEAGRKEVARLAKEQAKREEVARKIEVAREAEMVREAKVAREAEVRKEKAARKEEATKKGCGLSSQQIQKALFKLGMAQQWRHDEQTPTESDLSGSDYSETEKDARKRRGGGDDAEETNDSGDEEDRMDSPCKRNPKGMTVDALQLKDKGKGRALVQDSALVPVVIDKGNSLPTVSTPSRPSAEQQEKVKALRVEIEARVASLAEVFHAKPEAILKQLCLGGVADMRKASLVNIFSQFFSLNGGGVGLGRKFISSYFLSTVLLISFFLLVLGEEFRIRMIEEYHAIVDGRSANEREALRAEWQTVVSNTLEDEGKSLSAATRLKRAEKRMLNAVRLFFMLSFE